MEEINDFFLAYADAIYQGSIIKYDKFRKLFQLFQQSSRYERIMAKVKNFLLDDVVINTFYVYNASGCANKTIA